MTLDQQQIARLRGRLVELYGDRADACLARLLTLVSHHPSPRPRQAVAWDQRDVMLICYGDQVQSPGRPHLQTLLDVLTSYDIPRFIRLLHLLPFFPSSSDDGFAVVDYRAVDPELGGWNDVGELGRHFGLMFDLVINHVSAGSLWFQNYLKGESPYDRFFLEVDPGADVSRVVRPRSHPLLTAVSTNRGVRHVWMTFSADQVDLDYRNPEVLLEMIGVLLLYLQRGARLIRLDAIAYLWKELGTSCIHLRQTHVVVKLLRDLVDAVAPGTLLITETNVPHAENVSYFGDGDEAHLVYQFSLPPLLLEAFVSGDATALCDWLERLEPTRPGTAYLNFTASHDGIGVRPLEGVLPGERIARLVDAVRQRGGLVSTRRLPNGEDAPYELNITYLDALRDPADADPQWHVRRFLASQAIMLALRGIPAVYFHSLVGTANDYGGVKATGRARSINRRKYAADELRRILADPDSESARVFTAYRDLLARRIAQPAFHPDADQQVWRFDDPAIIGFLRSSLDRRHQVLVMANVSGVPKAVRLDAGRDLPVTRDLLTGAEMSVSDGRISLEPYQVVWLGQ
ncbi:MAG: alpha-amylase [Planctomycetaceae bacterium]|nr:alpha-amylase [Planctomycetaceae bacterium]